jgi:hypothetical protein
MSTPDEKDEEIKRLREEIAELRSALMLISDFDLGGERADAPAVARAALNK